MVLGSTDYNKKWNNDHTSKEGIRDKLREAAHSQTPLKPRIEEAQIKFEQVRDSYPPVFEAKGTDNKSLQF